MAHNIVVPSIGESVSEASIARWFVQEGAGVRKDQPLCELESDKVNVEIPAPEDGTVVRILKQVGEGVAIGEAVAQFEPGAAGSSLPAPAPSVPKSGNAAPVAAPGGAVVETPVQSPVPPRMGPAAKRLAEETHLDPATVPATGPGGRVTKADLQRAVALRSAEAAPAAPPKESSPPAPSVASDPRIERVRLSPLRRKVAERLVQAQQNAAILTTFNEVDMSAIMDWRNRFQDRFVEKYGTKLGFMSFFVKASIEALKAFPGVNAEIEGDHILYKRYWDIGVAVGGGKGLVVPIVRDADRLSFAQLEVAIGDLGKRARDNKLTLDDLTGGTFTLSNGGVYGSLLSTPILNPPQSGILGMHKIMDRPIAVQGAVVIRPMMYVALSYDHRLVDGREAVGFLVRVKECVEHPERMLLEV